MIQRRSQTLVLDKLFARTHSRRHVSGGGEGVKLSLSLAGKKVTALLSPLHASRMHKKAYKKGRAMSMPCLAEEVTYRKCMLWTHHLYTDTFAVCWGYLLVHQPLPSPPHYPCTTKTCIALMRRRKATYWLRIAMVGVAGAAVVPTSMTMMWSSLLGRASSPWFTGELRYTQTDA